MSKTLLEKAKAGTFHLRAQRNHEITNEHVELALAWIEGAVSIRQVSFALKHKYAMSAYVTLALSLKKHLLKNKK